MALQSGTSSKATSEELQAGEILKPELVEAARRLSEARNTSEKSEPATSAREVAPQDVLDEPEGGEGTDLVQIRSIPGTLAILPSVQFRGRSPGPGRSAAARSRSRLQREESLWLSSEPCHQDNQDRRSLDDLIDAEFSAFGLGGFRGCFSDS